MSTSWQAEQGWKNISAPRGPGCLWHHQLPCCITLVCRYQKRKRENRCVGAARLHVCWAMLNTQLESHLFLQRPQNTFLILTSAHSKFACFKWHKHGLHRDGTLCLPGASRGEVREGINFFLTYDSSYWKGSGQPDRSWVGYRFVGKQNWS